MLRNYLKIAFRNLINQKLFSFINIIGLAVGIACSILIAIFVNYELSFTPTGKIHYEGRKGQHDDYVCALALAVQKYKDVTEYTPLEFVFSSYDEDF